MCQCGDEVVCAFLLIETATIESLITESEDLSVATIERDSSQSICLYNTWKCSLENCLIDFIRYGCRSNQWCGETMMISVSICKRNKNIDDIVGLLDLLSCYFSYPLEEDHSSCYTRYDNNNSQYQSSCKSSFWCVFDGRKSVSIENDKTKSKKEEEPKKERNKGLEELLDSLEWHDATDLVWIGEEVVKDKRCQTGNDY